MSNCVLHGNFLFNKYDCRIRKGFRFEHSCHPFRLNDSFFYFLYNGICNLELQKNNLKYPILLLQKKTLSLGWTSFKTINGKECTNIYQSKLHSKIFYKAAFCFIFTNCLVVLTTLLKCHFLPPAWRHYRAVGDRGTRGRAIFAHPILVVINKQRTFYYHCPHLF